MSYSQCSRIKDLKFSESISEADEAIIREYCKFELTATTALFIFIFGGLGLYIGIAPWFSSQAGTGAKIFLSAFGAVLIGILALVLKDSKFSPEAIIYGTVDNAYSERRGRNGKKRSKYYAHVTFESTNQVIPRMRVPAVNGKTVKNGTRIMIVKRDDNKYEIIFPDYCKDQNHYTSDGELDT